METQEHEDRYVRQYFESQVPPEDEKIERVEKMRSERVLDKDFDVFDVQTDKGRWWVITNPTNLYSHTDLPSLDYALSFHIGLGMRVLERSRYACDSDEEQDRFARSWRRFEVAVDTFNRANEAEEFQNVAAQCRQTLIAFVRELEPVRFFQPDRDGEPPKANDVKRWCRIVARELARGRRVQNYLAEGAETTWDMVSWLLHYEDAVRYDAELALDATQNTLHAFGTALLRFETHAPDRCPECDSYRIVTDYRPELDDPPYVVLCAACGWETKVAPSCSDEARTAALTVGIEPIEGDFPPPPQINNRA